MIPNRPAAFRLKARVFPLKPHIDPVEVFQSLIWAVGWGFLIPAWANFRLAPQPQRISQHSQDPLRPRRGKEETFVKCLLVWSAAPGSSAAAGRAWFVCLWIY